jgi:hypothetical protein
MHERLQRMSGAMLHARVGMSDWAGRKRAGETQADARPGHRTGDETG